MRNRSLSFVLVVALYALLPVACTHEPDDQAITSELQAKLYQDPTLKARDIRVVSQKGVVVLEGTVNSLLEKTAVEQLAGQVKGVKQVINQLSVSGTAAVPVSNDAMAESPTPEEILRPIAPKRQPRRVARASSSVAPATAPATSAQAPAPPPPTPQPAQVATAPPPPPEPERVTIPAGTVVTIRMIDNIDSSVSRAGEQFAATVESPIVVEDRVVIPHGSDARVRLVQAASAGRISGTSELQVELVSLTVNGKTYNVESTYYQARGASRGKRTAETVGGGAALGALIGAIAGKGKGAAIGAAVGAGAGTATQAATRGQQVKISSETKLDFTLKAPVTVTF